MLCFLRTFLLRERPLVEFQVVFRYVPEQYIEYRLIGIIPLRMFIMLQGHGNGEPFEEGRRIGWGLTGSHKGRPLLLGHASNLEMIGIIPFRLSHQHPEIQHLGKPAFALFTFAV